MQIIDTSGLTEAKLIVVVDTEEEFDWSGPFDRGNQSVEAMGSVGPFQALCREYAITPVYVADYPVVTQRPGIEALVEHVESGEAIIGAHLHPWVNPPYVEEVCAENSYPCNLPERLEREKLECLFAAIETAFGARPRHYKAGRYGLGASSVRNLQEMAVEVDLSVNPPFNHGYDGGPDFSGYPVDPFWWGEPGGLLELPLTGGFVGWSAAAGSMLFDLANTTLLRRLKVPGVLSRSRALERLRLSPEGFDLAENRRLTWALHRRGVRVFYYSFHSPSLAPGHTPYVSDADALSRFLAEIRGYFEFFTEELGGAPATPMDLKHEFGKGI